MAASEITKGLSSDDRAFAPNTTQILTSQARPFALPEEAEDARRVVAELQSMLNVSLRFTHSARPGNRRAPNRHRPGRRGRAPIGCRHHKHGSDRRQGRLHEGEHASACLAAG